MRETQNDSLLLPADSDPAYWRNAITSRRLVGYPTSRALYQAPVSLISASSTAKIPFDPVLPDQQCSRYQSRMDQEGK